MAATNLKSGWICPFWLAGYGAFFALHGVAAAIYEDKHITQAHVASHFLMHHPT